ncbi:hypothetical protein [Bradyrhizobium elkanii]|uniref:hypothetical protein n=1 Tax=Bradyrhizobium elkanii TaxID=29448 RepID=UPI0034E50B43
MAANGRTRSTNHAIAAAAALLLVCVTGSASAQNFMRSPTGGAPQVSLGQRANPGMGRVGGNPVGGTVDRVPPLVDRGAAASWTDDAPRSRLPPPLCALRPVSPPAATTAIAANASTGRSPSTVVAKAQRGRAGPAVAAACARRMRPAPEPCRTSSSPKSMAP